MKIYILKLDSSLQPVSQSIRYPSFNDDYGVEQDFYLYITKHVEYLTDDPIMADYHYLPVYWTRWHLNHNYAKTGLHTLSKLVGNSMLKPSKTFTICQYDDGPIISLPKVKIFLSSRKTARGIDIPLLAKPHHLPWFKPNKPYLASFMGRLTTHKLRLKMAQKLNATEGIQIISQNLGIKPYINQILKSYVALCPRGYGGSSFRFYEAMQLGVVPFLIGNFDTRPFKQYIDWDSCSLYASNPGKIMSILLKHSIQELIQMGQKAKSVYDIQLKYQSWCNLVLKELESLT